MTREAKAAYGHEEEQQNRLPCRRVALDLGATLVEDEHLSCGLEHVVRGKQQEHQQRDEQHAACLALPHIGDRREQPLDQCLRAILTDWSHAPGPFASRIGSPCFHGPSSAGRVHEDHDSVASPTRDRK